MEVDEFSRVLERLWSEGQRRSSLFAADLDVGVGLETRTMHDRYDWDGLARGQTPYVVIQYTLSGWGAFIDDQGRQTRVDPGSFFVGCVPSQHRYFLPRESPVWRFFYIIIRHPFADQRFRRTLREALPVQNAEPDHAFTASLVRLLTAVRRGGADELTIERNIIDIALEHQRLTHQSRPGLDARERLLATVRDYLTAHQGEVVEVEAIATPAGLSRSAYSHHFTKLTGLSPARYIAQVRLDEVRRGLLEGNETLAGLAERSGFADANHLCKVFRRHFHQSPGQYRRQMGG